MAVLINDLEVILEPPPVEAGEATPQSAPGAPMPATSMSPFDLTTLIRHLEQRELRVRSH